MMQHSEFVIGESFWCGGRHWRCTDIGTRTIIAIRVDQVSARQHIMNEAEAEAEGWFNGPPYAVAEIVFDEHSMQDCTVQPDL